MENNFILKNVHGKSTLLDKQYGKLINNSLGSNDEKQLERWERYNLIVKQILSLKNGNILFAEIKYRLTDGENPNKVFLDILNRIDQSEVDTLLYALKKRVEEYEEEDYISSFY